jgi:hypothetical protein
LFFSEYVGAKRCVRNLLSKNCDVKGDLKVMADIMLDNYNQFCANGVDPTTAPPSTKPPSTAPNSALPKVLVIMVMITVFTQTVY